jgi:glycosyltransferase involved in cell wall biosynthesis
VSGVFIRKHAEAVARLCEVGVLFVLGVGDLEQPLELVHDLEQSVPTIRVFYRRPRGAGPLARARDLRCYRRAASLGLETAEASFGAPDLHHVHVNPPVGLVQLLRRQRRRVPYVFTEHWTGYFPEDGRYRGALRTLVTRRLVRGARAVTVVSEAAQRAMEGHGLAADYHVIPNVVDTDLFTPEPCSSPPGDRRRTLVHVSNLDPIHKNPAGLLRAVAALAGRRSDFRMLVVGDGPGRSAAEELAGELGMLDRRVFFLGRQEVSEVARTLAVADALVLFSNFENAPCVIAEAQACGLPVVATAVGGIPELVDQGQGELVAAGDEEGLREALGRLLDALPSCDRQRIRSRAVERYSYDSVGRSFCDLYESVLA